MAQKSCDFHCGIVQEKPLFHCHVVLLVLKPKGRQEPFCVFCDNRGHWDQDCKEVTDIRDRTELASRCFLCLNLDHSLNICSKKGKFIVRSAENPISTPFAMRISQYPLPWIKLTLSRVTLLTYRLPAFVLRVRQDLRSSYAASWIQAVNLVSFILP